MQIGISFIQKLVLSVGLLSLAACQSSSQDGLKSAAMKAGFVTTTTAPKAFVVKSRPNTAYTYPDITPPPPDRPVAQRSPEDLKALEGRLDATRVKSDRFAKRALPHSSYGDVAKARRTVQAARARANRPIYVPKAGETPPQPTSYPVPEARRMNGKAMGVKRMTNPLAIPKE